jgi:hypothetical protein
MFIIKTRRDDIHIDSDEMITLTRRIAAGETLILLRQGAVNPANIVVIVEDVDRKASIVKRPGDTEETLAARIANERSEDIFRHVRQTNNLLNTNNFTQIG